jgi:hypothetical protein
MIVELDMDTHTHSFFIPRVIYIQKFILVVVRFIRFKTNRDEEPLRNTTSIEFLQE